MITLALAVLLSPDLFNQHCASCHGSAAKAPSLKANPHVAVESDDQLRFFLQHGNAARRHARLW